MMLTCTNSAEAAGATACACCLPLVLNIQNGGSSHMTAQPMGPALDATLRRVGQCHTSWLLLAQYLNSWVLSRSHFKGTLGYYIMLQFVSVVCGEDHRAGAPGAAPKVASWLRRSLRGALV